MDNSTVGNKRENSNPSIWQTQTFNSDERSQRHICPSWLPVTIVCWSSVIIIAVMLWEGAILPHTATACTGTFIAGTWKQKQVKMILSHIWFKNNNNKKKNTTQPRAKHNQTTESTFEKGSYRKDDHILKHFLVVANIPLTLPLK